MSITSDSGSGGLVGTIPIGRTESQASPIYHFVKGEVDGRPTLVLGPQITGQYGWGGRGQGADLSQLDGKQGLYSDLSDIHFLVG